jgi:SAM-dependent methyltransferase
MEKIESSTMNVVISIESAFHYPDKEAFFQQVERVLKPGGKFLVADLLATKRRKGIGFRKQWKGKMVMHHWSHACYQEHFAVSPLLVEETHDITRPVIRGFRGYRKWIREIEPEGFVKDLFYSIFYIINVKLILILFRFRRKYMVFAGIKPQD